MGADSIVGAGILGSLVYNERRHGWAIELGYWLGTFVIAFTREHLDGADLPQVRQTSLAAIDKVLGAHGIHLSATHVLASSDGDAIHASQRLLDGVQAMEGDSICALVLIGQCAFGLRSVSDDGYSEGSVQAHGKDIARRCSSVGIDWEAFGNVLLGLDSDELSANGISSLLVRLSKPLNVLIMTSDPRDEERLRVGEESRELEEAIRGARFRRSLELHHVLSCRVRDIATALDKHDPDILHISGHGDKSGLIFENDRGEAISVDTSALADLLGMQKNLKLVVLNACYGQGQSQAIADAVGCVIGMEGSILDEDSIAFSRSFYAALGHGRTFEDAFKRAKFVMRLTTNLNFHFLKRSP